LTVIFGHVVTGRNVSLLFSGEFHNDHYHALLPVEEIMFSTLKRSIVLGEVSFKDNLCCNIVSG
jgi:hypothetical protein